MKILNLKSVLVLSLLVSIACGETKTDGKKTGELKEIALEKSSEVVVYTSVDQIFSEPVLKAFEKKSGIDVKMLFDTEETKSTGLLNRLIAESKNPRADVFWSGDPVRPGVLVKKNVAKSYAPKTGTDIPAEFKAVDGSWIGFSARARVLLVNNELIPKGQEPTSVEALVNPKWKGKCAIANPAFGTTTMHMAALFQTWGSVKMGAFFNALRKNDVRIASSNGEVKRLVVSGEVAFGLTDTDDASVAIRSGAPVRVVYPDSHGMGTLLMPTVAVLISGAPNQSNAKRLVDYLASPRVEEMLAFADCAQIPLRPNVPRPKHVGSKDDFKPMAVDYQKVADVMEKVHGYLSAWSEGREDMPVPPITAATP